MASWNCSGCEKEIWEKHTGEKCRLVIVLNPNPDTYGPYSNWYCIPCYRKVAKVGQHLSIGSTGYWSGRGRSGIETQILEVEVTEVKRNVYVGWRTIKQDYVHDPKPDTKGKGATITKGGFSLRGEN